MSVATSTAIGLGIAGAGVLGSVASGVIGSNAAGNAASTQANAANNAAALESQNANNALNFSKLQYGNSLALESPFYNSGVAANSQLDYLMGLKPQSGLPPGVINPNAPQTSTTANASPLIAGRTSALPGGIIGSGDSRSAGPVLAANGTAPIVNRATAPANAFSAQGATAPITQPGAVSSATSDTNSPLNTINGVSPINGGTASFPGAAPVASASTNVGGTGQAPIQGGAPGATATPTGTNGSFGSLAQGWDQTFNSPTNVTEQNDPGFQFREQQGDTALQNSAAARGGLLTGGTAKALTDFAQNDASNEYANVYNRALNNYNTNYNTFTNDQTNEFNRLASLSGEGQVSANNLSTAGTTTANQVGSELLTSGNQIGQNINTAGAANASGFVGGANAITNGINGSINSLGLLSMLGKPSVGAQAA